MIKEKLRRTGVVPFLLIAIFAVSAFLIPEKVIYASPYKAQEGSAVANTISGPVIGSYLNKVYLTNESQDKVVVFDIKEHEVVKTIAVGSLTQGVALGANKQLVYVVNTIRGTLSIIDENTDTVVAAIPLQHH